jgi:hypothetical protein
MFLLGVRAGPRRLLTHYTKGQGPDRHAVGNAWIIISVAMETCPGCGAQVEGGAEGCQAMWDRLSIRLATGGEVPYAVRRLGVDCYCLQHPDRYCVSAKSLAAHLTGLCWALEFGGGGNGLKALQTWLNGQVPLTKPPIPSSRGRITVSNLLDEPGSLAPAVERWARSIWNAYADLHTTATRWVEEATKRA